MPSSDNVVKFRVSEEEKKFLAELAGRSGVDLSTLIRKALAFAHPEFTLTTRREGSPYAPPTQTGWTYSGIRGWTLTDPAAIASDSSWKYFWVTMDGAKLSVIPFESSLEVGVVKTLYWTNIQQRQVWVKALLDFKIDWDSLGQLEDLAHDIAFEINEYLWSSEDGD